MMAKLVELNRDYWPCGGLAHWCPACDTVHEISVDEPNASGAVWKFDGNLTQPTFEPSVNYRLNTPDMKGYNPDAKTRICHYFLRKGKVQFLSDCTHDLAGVTVELPDFPDRAAITCRRLA